MRNSVEIATGNTHPTLYFRRLEDGNKIRHLDSILEFIYNFKGEADVDHSMGDGPNIKHRSESTLTKPMSSNP